MNHYVQDGVSSLLRVKSYLVLLASAFRSPLGWHLVGDAGFVVVFVAGSHMGCFTQPLGPSGSAVFLSHVLPFLHWELLFCLWEALTACVFPGR